MYENRQYNRPAKIEFQGKFIKHGNKGVEIDEVFLQWCQNNSYRFNSYNHMGEQLGLKGSTFKKMIKDHGLTLSFSPDSPRAPKIYQDKEWLKIQKVDLNKSNKTIAEELGCTERVIEKWAGIYHLSENYYKDLQHLNELQTHLIKASLLGDGCIGDGFNFVVSHNYLQKDYLFWKYEILKNICNQEPSYYEGKEKTIRGKVVYTKPSYRFNTKTLSDLIVLKNKPKIEIIKELTPFELSVWFLDDGYRSKYSWELCTGTLGKEEQQVVLNKLEEFHMVGKIQNYDNRYIRMGAESARIMDQIILDNIPNHLDIIQKKIFHRSLNS